MQYEYSRISIRENLETPFWDFTTEQLAAIKSTYDDTNRRIVFNHTVSEDGLTETRHHIWASMEDWVSYTTEYDLSWTQRDVYNAENNIVSMRIEN
jgi:hypothetical protein